MPRERGPEARAFADAESAALYFLLFHERLLRSSHASPETVTANTATMPKVDVKDDLAFA